MPGAEVGGDAGAGGGNHGQLGKRASKAVAGQPPGRDRAARKERDLPSREPRDRALLGGAARARRGPSVRTAGSTARARHVGQRMARREP